MRKTDALPPAIEERLAAIAGDHSSGASSLFNQALHLFALVAEALRDTPQDHISLLRSLGKRLQTLHPPMAPFIHLSRYVQKMVENKFDRDVIQSAFSALPFAVSRKLQKEQKRIIEHAMQVYQPYRRLMVHSRSSVVESFLQRWLEEEPVREIWITESRPIREGMHLAEALSRLSNRKVLLVDDARWLALDHVDAVVLGADRIAERRVDNKIGTYSLLMLAGQKKRPAYALAETIKFLPETIDVQAERGHASQEVITELQGCDVFNYYFESAPANFFEGVITTSGVLAPNELPSFFAQETWEFFAIENAYPTQ